MKKTWQRIKQIINMNNKKAPQITSLNYKVIDTNLDMVNTFNEFFTNIGLILDNKIPKYQRPNGSKVYLPPRIPHSFMTSPTNPQEINDLINSLDDTKSCGPCPVPNKLLKLASKEISIPLSNICIKSFEEGVSLTKKVIPSHKKVIPSHKKVIPSHKKVIPSHKKVIPSHKKVIPSHKKVIPSHKKVIPSHKKVIPSHKKGSTTDVNNYRPISLLSTLSKIVEKLLAVRLTSYLELHEIIYPEQFGFRAGYSNTHSLVWMWCFHRP